MMTSSRPRDVGGSFSGRRGHANQLSISDPSHHVTEAIGTMYGDGEDDDYSSGPESAPHPQLHHRPLSFIAAPYGDQLEKQKQGELAEERQRLVRSTSDKSGITLNTAASVNGSSSSSSNPLRKSTTLPARIPSQRTSSFDGPKSPMISMSPMSPLSPSPSLRDFQEDESGSQFPLTNIDNPNDIAQELSNLQALRRMSMDVGNTSDPDLLPFSGLSLMAMPSIAPTGDDDEGDPSRLLWVPARVHPELEPNAFKSFLENRVQTMKRRSGESTLSVDGMQRNNSGSLRRKKSMLSRQIDNTNGNGADGYVDGADRIDSEYLTPELSLNELVNDPTKAVQKLAQDARPEGASEGDLPILPVAPGMGLRRSTRTTYRKGGSLRHGDRAPFAKRVAAARQAERDSTDEATPVPAMEPPPPRSLSRVNSDPVTENYSRPTRSVRRQQPFSRETPSNVSPDGSAPESEPEQALSTSPPQQLPVRTSSQQGLAGPIPQIVETPPPPEENAQSARPFPQRSSSQKATEQMYAADEPPIDGPPARSSRRPAPGRPVQPATPAASTAAVEPSPTPTPTSSASASASPNAEVSALNDIANHPSPLPGSGSLRTDSLTFIPTLSVNEDKERDRKADRKSKDQDDNESILSTKSWKWFRTDDKDKKKKKEKEEHSKKTKTKSVDKSHDNARLDVLQNSIDNVVSRGRESLLLDRESIDNKLQEERKKESTRKSGEGKKDKDGFFGGLFGGSKRKSDKDPNGKKKESRALSPEPPARILRPDIDYAWTRFTIIEERAIYRMAHIKLANPRRSLQSQVLLSNFMYSYLAKVQAMHPQLQVPISPQQKRQEEERKRREAEQQQQQMLEQQTAQPGSQDGGFNFEYHRSGNQYGDNPQQDGGNQYVEDAHLYEYDHGGEIPDEGSSSSHRTGNGGGVNNYHGQDSYAQQQHSRQRSGGPEYSNYYGHESSRYEDDDRDDMW